MVENIWEKIHFKKEWGKYPNEELVRFVGRNFLKFQKRKRKNIKFLEVGCGQGANLWFLAKEGFDVYGVDISTSAITKAKKYLKTYNVQPSLKVADVKKLPFKNDFFNAVIDCATIQHLSFRDHNKAYSEILRVLKPNGYFWSFHIAEGNWGYGTGNIIDYKTFDNLSEGPLTDVGLTCLPLDKDLKKILIENKFKIQSIEKNIRTYENQKKEIIHWIIITKK